MLAGVVVVQALVGLGKTVARQIPNPDSPVGHDQHFGGLRQSVALGFGKQLFTQWVHALAGHHRATAQYPGPASVALDPLIQPETGAAINPMPALRFLAGGAALG